MDCLGVYLYPYLIFPQTFQRFVVFSTAGAVVVITVYLLDPKEQLFFSQENVPKGYDMSVLSHPIPSQDTNSIKNSTPIMCYIFQLLMR